MCQAQSLQKSRHAPLCGGRRFPSYGENQKRIQPSSGEERRVWRVGKYIHLSREDRDNDSRSVVNQDKILDGDPPRFFEAGMYEVVDTCFDGPVKIELNPKHPTARGALV